MAVLVRRLPDPKRLSIDRRTGRLRTEGIPFILNPVDLAALELALRLRDQHRCRVVVLSIDHATAEYELREALALGADQAYLMADAAFETNDPVSQAHVFQAALQTFVQPQLVLASARSIDHTWSTVGPHLAALMDWPLIVEAEEIAASTDGITALAHVGTQRARVAAPLPCVATVARDVVRPRHASAWGIADAYDGHRLVTKGLADLQLPPGAEAAFRARTQVRRVELATQERARRIIEGEPDEVARVVARRLIDKGWGGRRP